MKTLRCAWLVVLGAVAVSGCAQMASEPAGRSFDIEQHTVVLTPDFQTKTVRGQQQVRGVAGRRLSEVQFSANDLALDQVLVGGQPAAAERRGKFWVITLPQAADAGAVLTMDVRYSGSPAKGIVFDGPVAHSTYFACDWMLCLQDDPGDKAAIALTLRLPEGFRSVGPGVQPPLAAPRADGLVDHVWQERRPYAAYLFGFAAGVLQEATQMQGAVALTTLSAVADAQRSAALFGSTGAMLAFFQDKAGVPFPHQRYVQVHVAGHAAQEFASFSVIGDAVIAPILQTPDEDWVIAHELAHQWWGNLITCTDWSQFWLNEGITTFMVAAWKEQRWGRAAYEREMNLARARWDRARQAGFDVPLTFAGEYPQLGTRRAITYSKGALFMDALRTRLGDEVFWQALRGYTTEHAGRSVTTRDFQRSVERSSGQDLQALFAQWAY
jgi:aminopeptidase N